MNIKPGLGWVRGNLVPDESAAQEILKLRKRIDELEAKLAEAEFAVPAGSETLAQGDEETTVRYSYEYGSMQTGESKQMLSWNTIVSVLGPILIGHATEPELQGKLGEALLNRIRDAGATAIYSVSPRDEDFQQIKVQLRALGLIREAKDTSGKGISWVLTPYGDRLLMQVAAVRSPARAKEAKTLPAAGP
jgi:hypothetical protein